MTRQILKLTAAAVIWLGSTGLAAASECPVALDFQKCM